MKLTPHYKGTFEAFRYDGNQYARLELSSGTHIWFTFDFFTESYQSLENELNSNRNLQKQLETAYQECVKSMSFDSKRMPTAKEIFNLWGACSSPTVFARALP